MPSSTSSSSAGQRLPQISMARLWVMVLMFTCVIIGGLELALRHQGHTTSLTDTAALWAGERVKLEQPDTTRQIVILGDSRAQMGLNPAVFQDILPEHQPVMLAVKGSNCVPTLEDIALNTQFNGTLISAFTASLSLSQDDTQERWVAEYHSMYRNGGWLNTMLDQAMRTAIQKHLVIASITPYELLKTTVLERRLPLPNFKRLLPSRFEPADFYLNGQGWLEQCRDARLRYLLNSVHDMSQEDKDRKFDAMVSRVRAAVTRIQSRGGQVILVRMPTEGEHFATVTAMHPRERYWDTLAPRTGAKILYFTDYPQTSGFVCPDTSHMNYQDADRFTAALIALLREQHAFADQQTPIQTSHAQRASRDPG